MAYQDCTTHGLLEDDSEHKDHRRKVMRMGSLRVETGPMLH